MNKTIIAASALLMSLSCYSADIKGVVFDNDGHAIEYSSVRLTGSKDSMLIKSTVSGCDGEYIISGIENGTYHVTALCLGFEPADTCVDLSGRDCVVNFRLTPTENRLSEVVVHADRFVRGKNGITVLPGAEQVKHSSSGYELIRNLMIPGVSVDLRTNTVSALGGAVTMFIDGLPADERELKQLRPTDIKSVQYMDAPTGKYAGNNVVINLIMRKRNHGGHVAADAMQRIGYCNGDYNVASKLYKDNTQYTLFVGTDYQRINGSRSDQHEQIYFPDQIIDRSYITDDSRSSKNSQYAQFRVRNKNDRRTLRATLNFVRQHTPHDSENRELSYHGLSDTPTDIVSSRLSRSRNFKYSIGLSGSFSLPRNQFMEVSASASLSRNSLAYDYIEAENKILTSTGEDFYNMHADITYGMNFSHGNHLVFKASEFYNVSSANYFGNNKSWQHLWSSETLVFSEYMHPLWGKATIRVAPGLSAQLYRVHGLDLVKYFGPRMQLVVTYRPAQRQYLQLSALYGNSFPQLAFMSGATQQVDLYQVKRGNPGLKQTGISRFMAVYGVSVGTVNIQLAGIYNGATKLPVVTYYFEKDKLVQSYLPDGRWHQVDATLSATWMPNNKFNLQVSGGWLFNGYYGDADIHRSCWKGSAQASYYIGDFAINSNIVSSTKVVGYDLVLTNTPWFYGISASWSRNSLRIEVGTNNLFMHNPAYSQTLNTPQYAFKNRTYNHTDRSSAYIKVNWAVDFGKKVSHDKRNIDKTISTGIITPD